MGINTLELSTSNKIKNTNTTEQFRKNNTNDTETASQTINKKASLMPSLTNKISLTLKRVAQVWTLIEFMDEEEPVRW